MKNLIELPAMNVITEADDMEELFRAVRLAMKATKERCGLDPKNQRSVLFRLGSELGHPVARLMKARSVEELTDELTSLWSTQGLGEMKIVSTAPLVLETRGCSDCLGNRYGVGETLCPFKEGFLRAIIQDRLAIPDNVIEIECCGTSHDHCRFIVGNERSSGH